MKSFNNHTTLTKIISIVLLVSGIWGLFAVGFTFIPNIDQLLNFGRFINFFDLFFTSGLAILGLISGIALWRKKLWGFITASVFYALQLIMFQLPNFWWEPQSGFSLYYSFTAGYESVGNFGCGINFFALAMLILIVIVYRQIRVESNVLDTASQS